MFGGYRNKFVKVKTSDKRKTSSTKWLQRQLNDPYVAKAKRDGFRSRAAYKLLEIHEKFNIFQPGMKVIDLGAAPGGWSQVAVKLVALKNNKTSNSSLVPQVIGIDLLDVEPVSGVEFIKGDFTNSVELILKKLHNRTIASELDFCVDVVMSDMAANTIGHTATDHIRIMSLCEQALQFALSVLKPGGYFIAKIFQGGLAPELLSLVKSNFEIVKHFKPLSSRKESKELYIVALHRKVKGQEF
jgi:23S rRNA (uridine2552-2'-O)-methyltransferase